MIPLSHSVIRDYLTAARTTPADGTMARVYLFDRLADVGGFGFVGDPNGATLADACLWYARGADEDEPALRMALAEMDEMLYPAHPMYVVDNRSPRPITGGAQSRAELVRAMSQDVQLLGRLVLSDDGVQAALGGIIREAQTDMMMTGQAIVPQLTGNHPVVQAAGKRAKAIVVRDLRRRVLALYPEVEVTVRAEASREKYRLAIQPYADEGVFFAQHGFRLILDHYYGRGKFPIHCIEDRERRCWVYTQTITAPYLIAPEPVEYGESPQRQRYQTAEAIQRFFTHRVP